MINGFGGWKASAEAKCQASLRTMSNLYQVIKALLRFFGDKFLDNEIKMHEVQYNICICVLELTTALIRIIDLYFPTIFLVK